MSRSSTSVTARAERCCAESADVLQRTSAEATPVVQSRYTCGSAEPNATSFAFSAALRGRARARMRGLSSLEPPADMPT